MSNLARWKMETILEEMAEEAMYKSMARAYTRKVKDIEKRHHKELSTEFNCTIKKVHEKSLSNRRPRAYEPTLREALNAYYAEY